MTRPDKAPPSFPLYYKDAYTDENFATRARKRPVGYLLAPRFVGSRWVEIDPCASNHYPAFAGVYVISSEGVACYVGSSKNLRFRLMTYLLRPTMMGDQVITPWGKIGQLTIKVKPSRRVGEWLFDEYRLIVRLRPRFNRSGVRR